MKIAHFGTFDVENYGDLLFPKIIEKRLWKHDFTHVSPVGGAAIYSDSVKSIDFDTASKKKFDAVVVGGGNIIYMGKNVIPKYQKIAKLAYPSLWIGAAALACEQKIPLIVNAPSIREKYGDSKILDVLFSFAKGSSYFSVRDSLSASLFQNTPFYKKINCVPDTGFDVSFLWEEQQLQERIAFYNLLNRNYIVFHVNKRYLNPTLFEAAKSIEKICNENDAKPIFITIGPCHGDIEIAEKIASLIKLESMIISPKLIRDVVSLISFSKAYLGSSMHGYITALSFGINAVLVLDKKPHHKFIGLLNHIGLSESSIAESWDKIILNDIEKDCISFKLEKSVRPELEQHWSNIEKAIVEGEAMEFPSKTKNWKNKIIDDNNNFIRKVYYKFIR